MLLTIIAHPNSKRPRIDTDLMGTLHIYISAPPLEGRANEAVIEALAKHLNLPKSKITLLKGHKAKTKTFEISQK